MQVKWRVVLILTNTGVLCCRIYCAPPTAELEPLLEGKVAQTDEVGS